MKMPFVLQELEKGFGKAVPVLVKAASLINLVACPRGHLSWHLLEPREPPLPGPLALALPSHLPAATLDV